ncbi:MAG TPA: hypothetical protein ENI23_15050 [bacterium]|nr:hypothetical protein [bacterium]
MFEKLYIANRTKENGVTVEVGISGQLSIPLKLRLDLYNHSPDGFEWGYGGSGPTQLALALLADFMGDEYALANYHAFRDAFTSKIEQDKDYWHITDGELKGLLIHEGLLSK